MGEIFYLINRNYNKSLTHKIPIRIAKKVKKRPWIVDCLNTVNSLNQTRVRIVLINSLYGSIFEKIIILVFVNTYFLRSGKRGIQIQDIGVIICLG